jgi:hypothetical protein
VDVDLVSVETEDGVHLDGALRRPVSNSPTLGLDLVICHHGVGGNLDRPNVFDAVGDDLLRAGCAVLRVNSRGHDTAFPTPSGSLGSAFEIVDGCRHDWNAWLDFAERGGYRHVAQFATRAERSWPGPEVLEALGKFVDDPLHLLTPIGAHRFSANVANHTRR